MKKKLIAILAAVMVSASLVIPAYAVTPQYRPVSTQGWYINLQSALKSIKVTVPQGALDAAAQAGEDAGENIDLME